MFFASLNINYNFSGYSLNRLRFNLYLFEFFANKYLNADIYNIITMVQKRIIILPILFLILTIIFSGTLVCLSINRYPWLYEKTIKYIKQKLNLSNNSSNSYTCKSVSKIKYNDPIALHHKAAQSYGIPVLKDRSDVKKHHSSGKLVTVKDNDGYKINKLHFSQPLLTPAAYDVLKEIGVSFVEKAGNNNYFVVTSLTRTSEDQERLRKININATKNISTHSYGSSFDISYVRFNKVKGQNSKLQNILEEILLNLREEKKIYIIVEKKIQCYHITVRKK